MALIKGSDLVSKASGKLGGHVYSHNKSGQYVRSHTVPVNPRTTLQVTVRTLMQMLVAYWNETLDAAQRGGWNTFASNVTILNRLGDAIHMSGFNMFLRTNVAAMKAGITLIEDAPGEFLLPGADPYFAATASAATQNMSVVFNPAGDWANEVGGYLFVTTGKPKNTPVSFFNGPWRYAGKVSGAASPPSSPATIASSFTLVAGQKVWLFARILRADGRLGEPFRCNLTVGS